MTNKKEPKEVVRVVQCKREGCKQMLVSRFKGGEGYPEAMKAHALRHLIEDTFPVRDLVGVEDE